MSGPIEAGRGRHVGITGMAVMGQNLARNTARHGFGTAVHNRTSARVDEFLATHSDEGDLVGCHRIDELVESLDRPRAVIVMVKAGPAVDDVIAELASHLAPGDVIIDGGNSAFADSQRRGEELVGRGLEFLGCGVSGGEDGALNGPSLMPGGSRTGYDLVERLLTTIAAQVDGTPCCAYMGPGGAGHYVKMVHNGIEYADMQLIAETYDILATGLGLDNEAMADVFDGWNKGDLNSFLIDITAQILRWPDDIGDGPSPSHAERARPPYLLDQVVDSAGQKGTGQWTAIDALELGTPSSVLTEAVYARSLSALVEERQVAASLLPTPAPATSTIEVDHVRDALYAAKVIAYAQGFEQLRRGGDENGWDLHLDEVATIWRGGCIIRAQFLDEVRNAFRTDDHIQNLVVVPSFTKALAAAVPGLRRTVAECANAGIPAPALSSALAWFDGYRRARLPANLIQAQRDLFGAHTFRRVDRDGPFHSTWR